MKQALVKIRAPLVAIVLVAVREKVLHQGGRLPILRVVTLQSFAERDYHRAVEECVFTVTLLVSAPARIASDIGVRRSDDDTALIVFRTLKNVARFVAFDLSGLPQDLRIPGLAKPNSLWEGRRRDSLWPAPFSWPTLRQTMNAFDVSTGLDTESRHAWICIETFDLLVDGHQREDVVDSLFDREIGILEGILLRRPR